MVTEKLRLNLTLSLANLFYSSVTVGLLPYSPMEYRNEKIFRISNWAIGFMIMSTVHLIAQYHFASTEFSWGDKDQPGTLTLIIGVSILYMVPFMLLVDVIGFILNRNVLIQTVNRLEDIDSKLSKENIFIDYDQLKRFSIVLILLVTFFEFGLVIYDCFLFPIFMFENAWWIITAFPIYASSLSKVWFVVLVFNVQQKFKAINKHLENRKNVIFERKKRLTYLEIEKKEFDRRNIEFTDNLPGYLHKEIFTSSMGNKVKKTGKSLMQNSPEEPVIGNRFIQVMPIHKDSEKASHSKESAKSIFTLFNDMLPVQEKNYQLNDKLDKELTNLCHLHDEICDAGKIVNRMFSFQMLILMAHGFMGITAQFYFMYCGLMNQSIPLLFRSAESKVFSLGFIGYTGAKCFYTIYTCWKTKLIAQKTGVQIHKVANTVDEDHCYQIVNHLSLKLLNHKLNFTACGFFDLDMATLYAITGAITSYLIILIQFNLAGVRSIGIKALSHTDSPTNVTTISTLTSTTTLSVRQG